MAAAWLDADFHVLVRLAELREQVALKPDVAALHGRIDTLEMALGLTPGARRRLSWEIESAPPPETVAAPIQRIRVVDPRG